MLEFSHMDETAQNESTTAEAQTPKPTSTPTVKPKKSKKPIIITAVLVVILIILVGGGVYLWQQGIVKGLHKDKDTLEAKVASQSAQIKTLEKNSKDQSARINFLDNALREATAAANIELGELTITSVKGQHFTYDVDGPPGINLVLVDVAMKNDSEQILFLSVSSLKLKDADNKSYPQTGVGTKTPSGKVELFDQQIGAGETVSGTVMFFAPKTINLFTLFYNNQQSTFTVK